MKRSFPSGCLFVLLLAGCAGGSGPSTGEAPYLTSLKRMDKLRTGVLAYAGDWDEVLPPAGTWMDGISPYGATEMDFHSPASPSGYGYAFSSDLAGKALTAIESPATTPLLFDSTTTIRNATALPSTMPSPPRYGTKNTIVFADGTMQDSNLLSGGGTDLFKVSESRLKQVVLGTLMYANDYDGTLPLANRWVDQTLPYVKNSEAYRSPAFDAMDLAAFGYALNVDIAGTSTIEMANPANRIMEFDSTDTTRNATRPTSTLPSPPRYSQGNTVGFVDGHVVGLLPGAAQRVR